MQDLFTAILADPNVSDEFKFVLQGNAAQRDDTPMRRARYVASLIKFDHQFEFSDDQCVWRAGRDELQCLRAERLAVDADGALWRKHMHASYKASM